MVARHDSEPESRFGASRAPGGHHLQLGHDRRAEGQSSRAITPAPRPARISEGVGSRPTLTAPNCESLLELRLCIVLSHAVWGGTFRDAEFSGGGRGLADEPEPIDSRGVRAGNVGCARWESPLFAERQGTRAPKLCAGAPLSATHKSPSCHVAGTLFDLLRTDRGPGPVGLSAHAVPRSSGSVGRFSRRLWCDPRRRRGALLPTGTRR